MKKVLKHKKNFLLTIPIIVLICIYFFRTYYSIENRIDKIKTFESSNTKELPLGWIRVQGTNIDFPIFYYYDINDPSDPSFDLGWNVENNNELVNRTVIVSHNMLNVSSKPLVGNKNHRRFEQLMAYIYYDFVKQNKYIQYSMNGENYLFKIYGVSFQKEDKVSYNNIEEKEIEKYIKDTKKYSYFNFDIDVNNNDKLLTLVTCTRFFGNSDYSFVVDARMVRKNELIKNYKVNKKNNYKKIEKILKGDGSNE